MGPGPGWDPFKVDPGVGVDFPFVFNHLPRTTTHETHATA